MPKGLAKILGTILALVLIALGYGSLTGEWGIDQIVSKENVKQANQVLQVVKEVQQAMDPKPAPTSTTPSVATSSTVQVQTNALVKRVVDGDTLEVVLDSEGEAKVRLLGINTPESVDPRRPVECFGKEASKYTKELLEGHRVYLEADPQADERDKYNRLLRKVVMEDGRLFNTLAVSEGYAVAYTTFPMDAAFKRELKKLEEEARLAGRGLWDPQTCNGNK